MRFARAASSCSRLACSQRACGNFTTCHQLDVGQPRDNEPASNRGGDSQLVALSEGIFHQPANVTEGLSRQHHGDGLKRNHNHRQRDAERALATNEYRNFQVRIVTDATTPTAVGQRRRISSHTSGATGVFTVAAWAVTPSSNATFVIENDDKILLFTNQTTVYGCNITANTWDTSTWAAATAARGAGTVCDQAFGIVPDAANRPRDTQISSAFAVAA